MPFACWITKAKDPHSEYVIFIACPRQQTLSEDASMLSFMHIACLVPERTAPTEVVNARPLFIYRHHRYNYFTSKIKGKKTGQALRVPGG